MSSLELSQHLNSSTANSSQHLRFRVKSDYRIEDRGQLARSLDKVSTKDHKLAQIFSKDRCGDRGTLSRDDSRANDSVGRSTCTPVSESLPRKGSSMKGFFMKRKARLESSINLTNDSNCSKKMSSHNAEQESLQKQTESSLPVHKKFRLNLEPKTSPIRTKSKFVIRTEEPSKEISQEKSWSPFRPSKPVDKSRLGSRVADSEFEGMLNSPVRGQNFDVGGGGSDSNMKLNDLLMSPYLQNKVLSLDLLREITKPSKLSPPKIVPCLKATPKTVPNSTPPIQRLPYVKNGMLMIKRKCASVDKKAVTFSQNVLVYVY